MTGTSGARRVVVDASLAAMWVLPERYSYLALAIAEEWAQTGAEVVAPHLMLAEVVSALYKRIRRGELTLSQAQEALDLVLGFGVRIEEEPELHSQALALAHRLNLHAPYDAHYLAMAKTHRCEIWTGDERLYNAVRKQWPQIRWVGDYSPPEADTRSV